MSRALSKISRETLPSIALLFKLLREAHRLHLPSKTILVTDSALLLSLFLFVCLQFRLSPLVFLSGERSDSAQEEVVAACEPKESLLVLSQCSNAPSQTLSRILQRTSIPRYVFPDARKPAFFNSLYAEQFVDLLK